MNSRATGFPGVWVCGTDTGVGKTVVSAGLVRALAMRGCRVVALKPVVSGSLAGMGALFDSQHSGQGGSAGLRLLDGADQIWEDLLRLELAGGVGLTSAERSVYRLQFPAAPLFAAEMEGQTIRAERLLSEVRGVALAQGEFAVVEGVGGLRVPLSQRYDSADLARDLACPAVLVVGIRLGCINHALLTGEGLAARGIPLLGWVANCGLVPGYPHLSETLASIEQGLGVPCMGRLPALAGGQGLPDQGPDTAWLSSVEAQITAAALELDRLSRHLWLG